MRSDWSHGWWEVVLWEWTLDLLSKDGEFRSVNANLERVFLSGVSLIRSYAESGYCVGDAESGYCVRWHRLE